MAEPSERERVAQLLYDARYPFTALRTPWWSTSEELRQTHRAMADVVLAEITTLEAEIRRQMQVNGQVIATRQEYMVKVQQAEAERDRWKQCAVDHYGDCKVGATCDALAHEESCPAINAAENLSAAHRRAEAAERQVQTLGAMLDQIGAAIGKDRWSGGVGGWSVADVVKVIETGRQAMPEKEGT